MANAALDVDEEAVKLFVSAQELSSSVRSITIQIVDEKLVATGSTDVGVGGPEADFTALVATLAPNQAYFLLFCLTQAQDTIFSTRKQWCLFSLVPDTLKKVRDKWISDGLLHTSSSPSSSPLLHSYTPTLLATHRCETRCSIAAHACP